MALDQSLLRHALENQRKGSPCLIGHSQCLIDVGRTHPVLGEATAAIIHRQQGQDRPLVGCAECFAVGESGEHVQWCELRSQYRHHGHHATRLCQWSECPLRWFYGCWVPVDYGDNRKRAGVRLMMKWSSRNLFCNNFIIFMPPPFIVTSTQTMGI